MPRSSRALSLFICFLIYQIFVKELKAVGKIDNDSSFTWITPPTHKHRRHLTVPLKEREDDASLPTSNIIPPDVAKKELFTLNADDVDPLYILFTGDPQYFFDCTTKNVECKRHSLNCASAHLNKPVETIDPDEMPSECDRVESLFANELQRRSIFDLNRKLAINNISVVALVINGDLTSFGNKDQMEHFLAEWMTLPIPIYAGLGNHDYKNNVDDCLDNQCANRMLSWFAKEYAPKMQLNLDLSESNILWKSIFDGSLAYSVDFCSGSFSNCVHSIQLHDRPDYATHIGMIGSQWTIHGSWNWLLKDLDSTSGNKSWPILINIHDNSPEVTTRLISILKKWMKKPENVGIPRRIMVLSAHLHDLHSLRQICVGGLTTPFLYVGSVPNNRYTLMKFSNEEVRIFFMKATNEKSATTKIENVIDFKWMPCDLAKQ